MFYVGEFIFLCSKIFFKRRAGAFNLLHSKWFSREEKEKPFTDVKIPSSGQGLNSSSLLSIWQAFVFAEMCPNLRISVTSEC